MFKFFTDSVRLGADLLSSQKLLAAILLPKKSVMQVLAANILMRISIVKIVCKCFLPLQESLPYISLRTAAKQFSVITEDLCDKCFIST